MRPSLFFAATLLLALLTALSGDPAAGARDYLAGLDALEAARYADAVLAFTRAIEADDENPAYRQARGVAHVLAEQFPDALADLQRAMKLDDTPETRLWLAAAHTMSGDPMSGSKWFVHDHRLPRDYPELVYNEMAASYGQSRTTGTVYDRERGQHVPVSGPVRTHFAPAAALFVGLQKARGAAGGAATAERMKELYRAGDYVGAMRELRVLRASAPNDVELLAYFAHTALALGDAESARAIYTRLASAQTDNGALYAGRALAAGTLGDTRRVSSDLEVVERLLPHQIATCRAEATRRLTGAAIAIDPASGLVALQQAIRSGASRAEQVALALSMTRAVNARRLRVDESHQDRLRALHEALRERPDSADGMADLALYLWKASTVRGERACLGAPVVAYRHVEPGELDQARQLANAALGRDSRHPKALITLAYLQLHDFKYSDAERTIAQLAAVEPTDEELPMLYAQLLESVAALRRARASDLRQVRQWSDTHYIYTRWPSDAELAQADELERQAEQLSRDALRSIDDAAARFAGKPLGDYYTAVGQRSRGKPGDAVESLKRMVAADPTSVLGWSQLAGTYEELDMRLDAAEARATATNLVQTTATPLLELAWTYIVKTKYRSARELLDRALAIDPANGRVFAYKAVVALGQRDAGEAELLYRTALAVDDARAHFSGTAVVGGTGQLDDPQAVGLAAAVRIRLAGLLTATDRSAEAVALVGELATLESRFSRSQLTASVHTALLPDDSLEEHSLPSSPSLASLLASGHLARGHARLAAHQLDEAEAEYRAVRRFGTDWPATAPGRETMNVTDAWARLGLVRVHLARTDIEQARRLLTGGEGFSWDLPPELEAARKAVEQEVARASQQADQDERDGEERMTPEQRVERIRQLQREALLDQKKSLEASLNEPGIDSRTKRALQHSIDEIDRQLAQLDGTPPRRSR